jgi:hypothetical protein
MRNYKINSNVEIKGGQLFIYALYDGDNCIYVGQTINIKNRVMAHKRQRQFDRVDYKLTTELSANDCESLSIVNLQPSQNGHLPKNNLFTSLMDCFGRLQRDLIDDDSCKFSYVANREKIDGVKYKIPYITKEKEQRIRDLVFMELKHV